MHPESQPATPDAVTERRRPALVIAFTMPQLALLATLGLVVAFGLMFWMSTMVNYQASVVDRLDAIRQQSGLLRETIDAHVRIIQADNAALLFYAQAVCEQMATLGKQDTRQCHPERRAP